MEATEGREPAEAVYCDTQFCAEPAIDECPVCRLRACKHCRDVEGILDDCCPAAFAHPDFERARTERTET